MPEKTIQTDGKKTRFSGVKQCKHCQASFDITDKDLEFYDKVSPTFAGKKYSIPTPTFCPDCRQQRRYTWRNQRSLYKRKCDFSGESLIAMFPPDASFPVYHNKYRRANENDTMKFGIDFDAKKTFLEQFAQLQNKVPRFHRYTYAEERMLNSEFTNCTGDLKDCYLIFASSQDERCYYGDYLTSCDDCIDVLLGHTCQQCYQCTDIVNCNNLSYSQSCMDSRDGQYLDDCINCANCIGCIGLRNQSFCILNKVYDKKDFESKAKEIIDDNGCFSSEFLQSYKELYAKMPKKYMHGNNNENVSGDFINNSKNIDHGFDVHNAENVKYCAHFADGKNCMDFSSWGQSELCYEISGGGDAMYRSIFSVMTFGCTHIAYCDFCFYCHDCFGCVGLTNKQYCIFNKQYTKAEYDELVPKIIQHMKDSGERGELFPISSSIFGYNETLAQDYFPLTKDEAVKQGYPWMGKEYPLNIPVKAEKIFAKDLPVSSKDVEDNIVDKVIICELTGKPYRITKGELEFYRKHTIPLPKHHPDQRYLARFQKRNPRKLRDRKCNKCSVDIKTTYAPERTEIIYCEQCYNKEIYG